MQLIYAGTGTNHWPVEGVSARDAPASEKAEGMAMNFLLVAMVLLIWFLMNYHTLLAYAP